MKHPVVFVALIALSGCGPPAENPDPGNITLRSASIELPGDSGALPDGPGRELVASNCVGCHSAEMLTTQPPLKAEQWAATVKKMREIYHAPIAPSDDAAIVAYLSALGGGSITTPSKDRRP